MSFVGSATFDIGAMQGDEICFNITIIDNNSGGLFFVDLSAPDSFVVIHLSSVPVIVLFVQDTGKLIRIYRCAYIHTYTTVLQ